MKPAASFKKNQAIICGSIGLACMFGGIWLGDAQFLPHASSSYGVTVMRVFTVIIYALFFGVCFFLRKHVKFRLVSYFGICSCIGLLCFALGTFLLLGPFASAQDNTAIGWIALFLTKVIGAPLSVGLVCVFALLGREFLIRMSLVGMLGAFLLYSLFSLAGDQGIFDTEGLLTTSFILLAFACLLGMMGMNASPEGRASAPQFSSVESGVIKRPWRKVLTPGYIIMVIFSSIMLGLLRSGGGVGDPHKDWAALLVFAALIVVSLLWKGLRIEHLYYAALLCSAAGFLLLPVFSLLSPDIAPFLYGIGVALFEVVTWALVAWAVRNCTETLMTAAGARFIVTVGHLIGTLLVVLGLVFTSLSATTVFENSALLLMFIYIVLLVVLIKYPSLQAPFMTPTDASGYAETDAHTSALESLTQQVDEKQDAGTLKDLDYHYWQLPCDTIAETYHLTAREREVLELLARGRNLAAMEDKLVISNNTLKMHIRHIYTKLDIHSKQDVINMVEQLRLDDAV